MEYAGNNAGKRTWLQVGSLLIALLGAAIFVIGTIDKDIGEAFRGAVLSLIALGFLAREHALKSGREEAMPSHAETSAWSQLLMGLGLILVLGGISLGTVRESSVSYLVFGAYVLVIAFFPHLRRHFIEQGRRYREVSEDERERVIRAQGDSLSKRLLEFGLIALAVLWMLAPHVVHSLGGPGPLQIAAFLLLPILVANVAGEARVALLHWRDRR